MVIECWAKLSCGNVHAVLLNPTTKQLTVLDADPATATVPGAGAGAGYVPPVSGIQRRYQAPPSPCDVHHERDVVSAVGIELRKRAPEARANYAPVTALTVLPDQTAFATQVSTSQWQVLFAPPPLPLVLPPTEVVSCHNSQAENGTENSGVQGADEHKGDEDDGDGDGDGDGDALGDVSDAESTVSVDLIDVQQNVPLTLAITAPTIDSSVSVHAGLTPVLHAASGEGNAAAKKTGTAPVIAADEQGAAGVETGSLGTAAAQQQGTLPGATTPLLSPSASQTGAALKPKTKWPRFQKLKRALERVLDRSAASGTGVRNRHGGARVASVVPVRNETGARDEANPKPTSGATRVPAPASQAPSNAAQVGSRAWPYVLTDADGDDANTAETAAAPTVSSMQRPRNPLAFSAPVDMYKTVYLANSAGVECGGGVLMLLHLRVDLGASKLLRADTGDRLTAADLNAHLTAYGCEPQLITDAGLVVTAYFMGTQAAGITRAIAAYKQGTAYLTPQIVVNRPKHVKPFRYEVGQWAREANAGCPGLHGCLRGIHGFATKTAALKYAAVMNAFETVEAYETTVLNNAKCCLHDIRGVEVDDADLVTDWIPFNQTLVAPNMRCVECTRLVTGALYPPRLRRIAGCGHALCDSCASKHFGPTATVTCTVCRRGSMRIFEETLNW